MPTSQRAGESVSHRRFLPVPGGGQPSPAPERRPLVRRAAGKLKGIARRVLRKVRPQPIPPASAPQAIDPGPAVIPPRDETPFAPAAIPGTCAFLVSTTEHATRINSMVGAANYSYFFVYKYFHQLLEKFGPCRLVPDAENNLRHAAGLARQAGYTPVHLSFNPPHEFSPASGVPNILLPQWEFPDIPDRDLGGNPKENWVRACNASDLIVVSSGFTGDGFRHPDIKTPIALIPIPLSPAYGEVPDWDPGHRWTLNCRHVAYGGGAPARPAHPAPSMPEASPLTLSGYVYSSAFNLCDERKNFVDMLSAFLRAFQDRPDVTLVLKLNIPTCRVDEDFHKFNQIYYRLNIRHACKVVVVADYFDQQQMLELIKVSTFYVSTSRAEGANMILQQALAAGRPPISPRNTAMLDYINDEVAFVVGSHPEPTYWPHDPEHAYETVWHRIVWQDLCDQYRQSLATVENDRARYDRMAATARRQINDYAGHKKVAEAFRAALGQLKGIPAQALQQIIA